MSILNQKKFEVVIASDVSSRDGIGVEVYENGDLILDVFRDDTRKTKEVTLFKKQVPLDIVEESLRIFRKKIPQDFQD